MTPGDRVAWNPLAIEGRPEVIFVVPGKPHGRKPGTMGTVVSIAYGLLGVSWDDGTSTALYPEVRPAVIVVHHGPR